MDVLREQIKKLTDEVNQYKNQNAALRSALQRFKSSDSNKQGIIIMLHSEMELLLRDNERKGAQVRDLEKQKKEQKYKMDQLNQQIASYQVQLSEMRYRIEQQNAQISAYKEKKQIIQSNVVPYIKAMQLIQKINSFKTDWNISGNHQAKLIERQAKIVQRYNTSINVNMYVQSFNYLNGLRNSIAHSTSFHDTRRIVKDLDMQRTDSLVHDLRQLYQ